MCRSDTLSLSLPTRRSTEPEVFTFDRIPAAPVQCSRPRPRRVRVLYPSTGRRYLPPAERSPAKRWLLALCLVVLLQIYSEDDAVSAGELLAVGDGAPFDVLPFAVADEARAARHEAATTAARTLSDVFGLCPSARPAANSPAPRWRGEPRAVSQQSARNGYVVALLYPVYHTLGSEQ